MVIKAGPATNITELRRFIRALELRLLNPVYARRWRFGAPVPDGVRRSIGAVESSAEYWFGTTLSGKAWRDPDDRIVAFAFIGVTAGAVATAAGV